MHVRVGDMVEVIAGNDRGTRGKVLSVNHDTGKLVVEGVNRVFKHMRKSQRNPQGGRLQKEMPIRISNVALLSPQTKKKTRAGVRIAADGSKELYCKKSGSLIRVLAPPRASRATAK